MIFHNILFKRFFFRKNQNSSTDWLLPVIFASIVALSSALIFFSSIQLYDYDQKKEAYLSDKSNYIYHLSIQDTVSYLKDGIGFHKYKKILEDNNDMSFYKGFDRSPRMAWITSTTNDIERIQTYVFDNQDSDLVNILTNGAGVDLDKHFIYLNDELMKNLSVEDNHFVLIKLANPTSAYTIPIQVKRIEQETKLKSYMFADYLDQAKKIPNQIRFKFTNITDAVSFVHRLNEEVNITPYYIGIDRNERIDNFLAFIKSSDENETYGRGKKEPYLINEILKKKSAWKKDDIDPLKNSDTIRFTYAGCEATNDNPIVISESIKHQKIYLDKIENKLFSQCCGKIDIDNKELLRECKINHSLDESVLLDVDLFDKKSNSLSELYVGFDFKRNLSQMRNPQERQKLILGLLQEHDKISFYYEEQIATQRRPNYYFIYYNSFIDDEKNKNIKNKFDELNIRWDNARWQTIIELNKSLKEGKENLIYLIAANIITFFLILSIKFILRLKLELHSIGVLKCFGYSKKVIYMTYNSGNLIMISIGFLIGNFIIGTGASLMQDHSINYIISFYNSEYFYFCIFFFFLSMIASLATTTYFLSLYTEKDNIYELIKYES